MEISFPQDNRIGWLAHKRRKVNHAYYKFLFFDEVEYIGQITKRISEILSSSQSKGEELMCTSIIGQIGQDAFEKVLECLMNDNISRVGIYGMGGIGKTTIATRINDELLARTNSFTHVCWVTVSKDLSIWKLQNEIAKTIKLDLSKEDDELKRAAKLRKWLKTKKFVLILDDIWEAFEIEEVGIPPLDGAQKLLLTSRNLRVCEKMECKPIKIEPLLEQEALDLFIKESKYKTNDSLERRETMHSIVKECAGLPLAIVIVARRMRGVVEISEWRNTLRELKKPCEGGNQEVERKVFRSLKFSYDRLLNDKVRQCFLYCSLFPEGYSFNKNDLITYLIGEGIINGLDSRQAELDKGHCMIDELIHASLLERNIPYSVEVIKMHDVVRDMALIVIRENIKQLDGLNLHRLSEETETFVNLESVLIVGFSMLESGVSKLPTNSSKVTTLIFDFHLVWELPSCYFANLQNLVVLDMSFMFGLNLLPDSISNLGSLRILLLSCCVSLKYIPSLDGLKNLWHLDLSNTNLKEIPTGMEGLTNLRVLKLSSKDAFFQCDFLEKLSQLQILELERAEVEADILISLKKLEMLRIVFYKLDSLNLYFKSGHWKRLEEYYVVYFRDKGRSASEMWKHNHKKVLYIDKRRDFGVEKGETDMVLPNNIQHLLLEKWNGPMVDAVMNSAFDNLRKLVITGCGGRQHLFTPVLVLGVLLNIEILHIRGSFEKNCLLQEIISAEEELVGEINDYTTIQLPKLKCLHLFKLSNLRSIYKGRMVCPSLKLIEITSCEKLERLPFCMKEGRSKHNHIKLDVFPKRKEWWDALQWDDPDAKSVYQFGLIEYPLEDFDLTRR